MNSLSALPITAAPAPAASRLQRALRHPFGWLVVLPTILAALYLSLIASNQYRSEAQFVVRGIQPESPNIGGFGQLLGLAGGLSPGQKEAQSIREYLLSMDAIAALKRKGVDLVRMYHAPEIDLLSKLRFDRPRAETLRDYYRGHVDLLYDPDDNITRIAVRAFRPEDAQRLARALLALGEERVNAFNTRLFAASFAQAQGDLTAAEIDLATIQAQLTAFRENNRDIDPLGSGEGGQKLLGAQQAQLDAERALLSDMAGQLSPSSPQVQSQRSRVAALTRSLDEARGRLTGAPQAVSARLGGYESLKLRQDFAAKRYEVARGTLEQARDRAEKDRLFIVPVVQPNLPERPSAPQPIKTTLTIFLGLCLAYGIGWMLLAGIREHRA